MKGLEYSDSILIDAPRANVWALMLSDAGYREWTRPFCEGSYYQGRFEQGASIQFLAPNGDGMISEIAELRLHELVSIRHLGYIHAGIADTTSDAVRAWAPMYENYRFEDRSGQTEVKIWQQLTAEYEDYMRRTWPLALAALKTLCER
jgi:hypothetical protein